MLLHALWSIVMTEVISVPVLCKCDTEYCWGLCCLKCNEDKGSIHAVATKTRWEPGQLSVVIQSVPWQMHLAYHMHAVSVCKALRSRVLQTPRVAAPAKTSWKQSSNLNTIRNLGMSTVIVVPCVAAVLVHCYFFLHAWETDNLVQLKQVWLDARHLHIYTLRCHLVAVKTRRRIPALFRVSSWRSHREPSSPLTSASLKPTSNVASLSDSCKPRRQPVSKLEYHRTAQHDEQYTQQSCQHCEALPHTSYTYC